MAKDNVTDLRATEEPEPAQLSASEIDEGFMQSLRDAESKLKAIDEQRAELNASKAEVVATLVNKGLNKDAVRAAIAYCRTPEDKRQNFDLSYQITRKALGHPVQDDLFVASVQREVDAHQSGK